MNFINKTNVLLATAVATLTTAIAKPATPPASGDAVLQSSARPLGLGIVGKVNANGSDDAAKDFRASPLQQIAKLAAQNPSADNSIERAAVRLDPNKLRLAADADVRMYFVAEDTSYANTLGFTTDGSGTANSATAKLIFPNASTDMTGVAGRAEVKRTDAEPLLPGDFVNLGHLGAGTSLDFFLLANGANGGTKSYSTRSSANADGIGAALAYAFTVKDSTYLVLAFEDLSSSSDRAFSDLIVAMDIGKVNMAALTATPEPATYASMAAFLGLGWVLVRRNRSTK